MGGFPGSPPATPFLGELLLREQNPEWVANLRGAERWLEAWVPFLVAEGDAMGAASGHAFLPRQVPAWRGCVAPDSWRALTPATTAQPKDPSR